MRPSRALPRLFGVGRIIHYVVDKVLLDYTLEQMRPRAFGKDLNIDARMGFRGFWHQCLLNIIRIICLFFGQGRAHAGPVHILAQDRA